MHDRSTIPSLIPIHSHDHSLSFLGLRIKRIKLIGIRILGDRGADPFILILIIGR